MGHIPKLVIAIAIIPISGSSLVQLFVLYPSTIAKEFVADTWCTSTLNEAPSNVNTLLDGSTYLG